MSDLVIRTRPHIDIPLAIVAIGLALLLAVTAHGATVPHAPVAMPTAPVITQAPAATDAPVSAPAAPKEKPKGKGHD